MSTVRVLVSGAAGNIGYAILPMIVGCRVVDSNHVVQRKRVRL